ncbi:MAG: TspO/MBR family protein [Chloroflexota bacterium]
MERNRTSDVLELVASLVVCLMAGAVGSIFTTPSIPTWYASLQKPFFNPPGELFAPVWTLLYLLMGLAAFFVWREGLSSRRVRVALALFLGQLALNILWSGAFFGMRSTLFGLIVIIPLWLAILVTMVLFFRVRGLSGWLMLPYLLWVTFASVLNIALWQLNL